jgi:hypothetical protein
MPESCRLCHADSNFAMSAIIMDKYNISYHDCPNCGYVQTEKPFWLSEAYATPINESDTGIISRNYQNSKILYFLIVYIFGLKYKKITHLDHAAGYGMLVGLMREFGIKSYWSDKYCENIYAKKFIYDISSKKADVLSAFEVFEHFENPKNEIDLLLSNCDNLIFSTMLINEKIPSIKEWWYYGVEHGQHIGFYRKKTLNFIAKSNNLNIYSNGSTMHCLTKKRLSNFYFKMVCFLAKVSMISILKKLI